MDLKKIAKVLLLASAALAAGKAAPGHKAGSPLKEDASSRRTQEIMKPLEPVGKAYWLLHPRKALYLYLFQKAVSFTWIFAKRYFKN